MQHTTIAMTTCTNGYICKFYFATAIWSLCVQLHWKNTWVTSTTFLGCLSCISVTKECYQMSFLEGSLRSVFISCRRPIWLHSWHYYHNHATKAGAVVWDQRNNKPHQKCWFMGFLKGDPNLRKEGSFSTKHFQIVSIPWTLRVMHAKRM